MRILAGYDRVFWKGLVGGVRLGYSIGGQPTSDDVTNKGLQRQPRKPPAYLPLHAELRLAYRYRLPGAVADNFGNGFRPFGFVAGGIANMAAGVSVSVCDQLNKSTGEQIVDNGGASCKNKTGTKRTLDVYQVGGIGFVGIGGGMQWAFTDNFGLTFEHKLMFMVPTFELGPDPHHRTLHSRVGPPEACPRPGRLASRCCLWFVRCLQNGHNPGAPSRWRRVDRRERRASVHDLLGNSALGQHALEDDRHALGDVAGHLLEREDRRPREAAVLALRAHLADVHLAQSLAVHLEEEVGLRHTGVALARVPKVEAEARIGKVVEPARQLLAVSPGLLALVRILEAEKWAKAAPQGDLLDGVRVHDDGAPTVDGGTQPPDHVALVHHCARRVHGHMREAVDVESGKGISERIQLRLA